MGNTREVGWSELERPSIPFNKALSIISGDLQPLDARLYPLEEALGCVVRSAVTAPTDVPDFLSSAMDGYAVRAEDCVGASESAPRFLTVTGSTLAGDRFGQGHSGGAHRVMTGSQIPNGSDAVVPWEATDLGESVVGIRRAPRFGENVKDRGDDIPYGLPLVEAQSRLSTQHIAALAAVGTTEVYVTPRPRIGLLTTGDEIVPAGRPLQPGQVYDSNGPFLHTFVSLAGGSVAARVNAGDEPRDLQAALEGLADSVDLIVTTGGASVGVRDWVRDVIEAHGSLAFWRIAMKPGKPVAYGRFHSKPILALPGNPSTVVACSVVLLRGMLGKMMGRDNNDGLIRAPCAKPFDVDPRSTLLVPVRLQNGKAVPMARGHRTRLGEMPNAHGFAVVPPVDVLPIEEVDVYRFPGV